MKKKLTTVAFKGTPEMLAELDKLIADNKGVKGAIMPVLQGAQAIYGYLPIEVINHVAAGLEVPAEEIYGVASFYSQFSLNPKGEVSIAVCLGTACYVKGSGDLINKISEIIGIGAGETSSDGKYSLDATRCIGACGLAPVLTVNDEVYGRLTVNDIPGIIAKYQ